MQTATVSVRRARLFYDQFRWCARYHMPECHALRRLEHRWIDRTLEQRRRWGRRLCMRPVTGSWRGAWEQYTVPAEAEHNLHTMCDFLQADTTPRRIRIQEHNLFVYANDPALFDSIKSLGVCALRDVVQIDLAGVPGAVNLRSSDHALRTFLRARRLPANTAASLRGFLLAQQDVRLSPSLTFWCDNNWIWTQRHYFFDHHSSSTANMLELIVPGLVKSTLPITTDK